MKIKRIKKISKVGEGLAIFLTKECRDLNWTDKDYVSITVEDDSLVLKRIKI